MVDLAGISQQVLDYVLNKRYSFIETKVTYLIGREANVNAEQSYEETRKLWQRHFKEINELISSLDRLISACSLAQNQLTTWQSPQWIHASGVIAKYHEELRELKNERKGLRLRIPIQRKERTDNNGGSGNNAIKPGI